VIRSAPVDEALSTGIRRRLDDIRERLARLEARGTKKRQLALGTMNEVGLGKLPLRRSSPGDRHFSGKLKCGAEILGAQLNNPNPILVVRTK